MLTVETIWCYESADNLRLSFTLQAKATPAHARISNRLHKTIFDPE
jgi:hypothetical protein